MARSADGEPGWDVIDRLRGALSGGANAVAEAQRALASLSTEDLASFYAWVCDRLNESRRWDLWAVGAILSGPVGEEFQPAFQHWCILQGRQFFTAVLKDPARAAEHPSTSEPSSDFSGLSLTGIVSVAYEERTGDSLRSLSSEIRLPAGLPWGWRDLRTLQPALWERFFRGRDRRAREPLRVHLRDADFVHHALHPLLNWVDIYGDADYLEAQYATLSPHQSGLHAVWWLKSEVEVGGYAQFFENPAGMLASRAVEGLRQLGADLPQAHLSRLIASFPDGRLATGLEERRKQIRTRWGGLSLDDVVEPPGNLADLDAAMACRIRSRWESFFRV